VTGAGREGCPTVSTDSDAAGASPDFEAFCGLSLDYSVVPVWRELIADSLTPIGAFRAMVGDGPGFLLESVEHGERWSRFSFVGRSPAATLVTRGRRVEVTEGSLPASVPRDRGVLDCIESLLDKFRSPAIKGLPPLHGGLVGYLGYDVVREVERLPAPPVDDIGHPDAVISVIGELAAFDHWRQRVTILNNVLLDTDSDGDRDPAVLRSAYLDARRRLDVIRNDLERQEDERLATPPAPGVTLPDGTVRRGTSAELYHQAVEAAKEYIRAGDAFQVVLSQRFDFDLGCDPFDVYRVLRQVNPSPYMFFLRQGGVSVVGASPEPMVQVLDGRVVSRPIAGTRRRGSSDEEDRLLEAELVENPKELAEHVMLVDLARNDVGRIARFGTERVDELMTVERYSHVMHLTSQVSGDLVEGRGPVDVLRATLPAGTVSGAPKVRAMEIIDELEPTKRGPYAGVVGYIDFSGNLDTAIAIRTLVVTEDGKASVQAGAGIVADSDPAAEDEECAAKAAAVLAAVAGARQLSAERR
jgi:anthranilate synthase component 1